jgi:transcriptional regulator with GAF, ATPase, and Fis domain
VGKFEVAHRGTLFLDEIGELPLLLQAKILRVIEERRFERVGSNVSLQVDVRIVAATNRNLKTAVATRRFREDLYFRLSVFPLTVPPLRDRRSDVPILARHFVERFCRDQKKRQLALSPAALEALTAYNWPGNVRELQNCLERAVILTDGDTIHPAHLQLAGEAPGTPTGGRAATTDDPWDRIDLSGSLADASRRVLAEAERRKLRHTLQAVGGDRARAAEILQIPLRMLNGKLRDHKIE